MKKSKNFLVITLIILFISGCGGAKIKVKNDSLMLVKDFTIIRGPAFDGIIYPGSETEYQEIEEGAYDFYCLFYEKDLDMWFVFEGPLCCIEEGGLFASDKEYIFKISGGTNFSNLDFDLYEK